jgi:hypothetical protein
LRDPLGGLAALENALGAGQELDALFRVAFRKPTRERGKIEGLLKPLEGLLKPLGDVVNPLKNGLGRVPRVR